jgi:acetyl-CoA synthetase
MFVEYLGNPAAYEERFAHGYYRTGDLAHRDADGYFWFTSRSDDVINTAGHLVSPFEVESALLEVPEVAEAAVVGAPDPILFEKVVAFVRLRAGLTWTEELALTLRLHVTHRVSSLATPQDLIPVAVIPKNKSGKTLRRVLKARYLGEDPGDTSTLEEM